jgi:2,4-dienoyl-CoA reductase-like NADH-dependent reductase (Old Yellow Enzyme family)
VSAGAAVRLFDPLTLGGLSVRNRVMMSPMSQRVAGEDGRATDWHLVHYGSRAVGGCGLIMVEDTAVAPLGRTGHAALGLYDRQQAEQLRRIVSFCRGQGAAVGVQLAHAGRKALADTRGAAGTLAPTTDPYGPEWAIPREATATDLGEVVDAFVAAADLATQAGFDVIEVHAAHGYLLHQFLSPLVNRRSDGYGLDSEGRRRLLIEVVSAVRECWPVERPLFVRLPAGDGAPGGLRSQEVLECACACAVAGATVVDLTGGTPLLGGERVSPQQTWEIAAALRGGCELPLALGGGIVVGADAQRLLDEHGAALVSVGRPLLEDPYWSVKIAHELDVLAPLHANYAAALQIR